MSVVRSRKVSINISNIKSNLYSSLLSKYMFPTITSFAHILELGRYNKVLVGYNGK